jgi:hypothetical protein
MAENQWADALNDPTQATDPLTESIRRALSGQRSQMLPATVSQPASPPATRGYDPNDPAFSANVDMFPQLRQGAGQQPNLYEQLAQQALADAQEKPKDEPFHWRDVGKSLMAPLAVGLLSSLVYPKYAGRAAGIGQGIQSGIQTYQLQQKQEIERRAAAQKAAYQRANVLARLGQAQATEGLRAQQLQQTGELKALSLANQAQANQWRHEDAIARIQEAADAHKQASLDRNLSAADRLQHAREHDEMMLMLAKMRDAREGEKLEEQRRLNDAKIAHLKNLGALPDTPENRQAAFQLYMDLGQPAAARAAASGLPLGLLNKVISTTSTADLNQTKGMLAQEKIDQLKAEEREGPALAASIRPYLPELADELQLGRTTPKDALKLVGILSGRQMREEELGVKKDLGEGKLALGTASLQQRGREFEQRIAQEERRTKVLEDKSAWAMKHGNEMADIAHLNAETRKGYSEAQTRRLSQEADHKAEMWEREKGEAQAAIPVYQELADKGNTTAKAIVTALQNGALLSDPSMKPLVTALERQSRVLAPVKVIDLSTGLSKNVTRQEALDNETYRPWTAQAEKNITVMKSADAAIAGLLDSIDEAARMAGPEGDEPGPMGKTLRYWFNYKIFGGMGLSDEKMNQMSWTDLVQQQMLGTAGVFSGSRASGILLMITNHLPKQQDSTATLLSKSKTMELAMDLAKDAAGYKGSMIHDPEAVARAKKHMGVTDATTAREYEEKFRQYLDDQVRVRVDGQEMSKTELREAVKAGKIRPDATYEEVR